MNMIRRLILALVLSCGLAPVFAQVPAPVPALPDTERRTSYSITATTCACAVNFALYGDSTDYANWVEVFLNGVRVNFNDATFGWTITVPTQTLATRARPISDAILTFNSAQTGTVQIVGARRPRRAVQFAENAGVSARNLNQVFTDIIAQNREIWDKTSDMTGRALMSQPGVTLGLLPLPSACVNGFIGFDATGLNPLCRKTITSLIQMLSFASGGSLSQATTYFMGPSGAQTTETLGQGLCPIAGTFRNLFVLTGTVAGSAQTVTATMRTNGASGALTCAVSTGSTTCNDTTHTTTCTAGQPFDIQVALSATTGTVSVVTIGVEFDNP